VFLLKSAVITPLTSQFFRRNTSSFNHCQLDCIFASDFLLIGFLVWLKNDWGMFVKRKIKSAENTA
jgi:hypothetical protein